MTKMTKPNQSRKDAEQSILKNMRDIKDRLDKHRKAEEEPIDKEQVMSVLTKFLKLKKTTIIH